LATDSEPEEDREEEEEAPEDPAALRDRVPAGLGSWLYLTANLVPVLPDATDFQKKLAGK